MLQQGRIRLFWLQDQHSTFCNEKNDDSVLKRKVVRQTYLTFIFTFSCVAGRQAEYREVLSSDTLDIPKCYLSCSLQCLARRRSRYNRNFPEHS